VLADRMAAAAGDLLALAPAALLPFDDGRREWDYRPLPRSGASLSDLDRAGVKAAHRLLAVALPLPAFTRAVAVMALDEVLDVVEGHRGDRRHRDDYWVAVFGEPGPGPWGWRFEGHHVSVHATVAGGDVRLTPLFLGANPAVVVDGGHAVSAPLGPEEALGFDLLHALTAEQRSSATIADKAPPDILTGNARRLDGPPEAAGVPIAALAGPAASAAAALLEVYLGRLPDGAARPDPSGAAFAWAGAAEPGAGHYYRLAGPRLLVELDNTQNGANHVHTVVRDPAADFGDDVLGDHLRRAHGGGVTGGA
jgi:Protein of unknown function (DUF3500)